MDKNEEEKVTLNQEAIQICPVCEERSVVVWYSTGYEHTKMLCLECGRVWMEVEEERAIRKDINPFIRLLSEEGNPNEILELRSKELNKQIERLVDNTVKKIFKIAISYGPTFDMEKEDAIKAIELCLEKMKKEVKK